MEKRDYLETLIEQMGLFIKKMLSGLINDIGTENEDKTINTIEESFLSEFKISIDELIALSETDFNAKITEIGLKETHIENLSELLYQMSLSHKNNANKSNLLNKKALLLLDLADSITNSYSINRINKKNKILNSKF